MAVDSDTMQNGTSSHASHSANGFIPGTTISTAPPSKPNASATSPPQTQAGPPINNQSTTLTLYSPADLVNNPILIPLFNLVNLAFDTAHDKHDMFDVRRLSTPEYYLDSLGSDPGTFAYILTDTASQKPLATAGAHRYVSPVFEATTTEQRKTFSRLQLPAYVAQAISKDPRTEVWELKLMAVDPSLQGQGLAKYLMEVVDREVVKRVRAEGGSKLFMLITTLKEINGKFYERRGYRFDYETVHEKGWMGSRSAFGVVHMSREVSLL